METEEIVKLSREAVINLIKTRRSTVHIEPFAGPERRRSPRWPFPGQVEVRVADDEQCPPGFFDCRDLSETGMGMCGDHHYPVGTVIELALHVPELTLYGRAVVRYCMQTSRGHMMGVEFLFDE
ncbi:MAG TPA: PilZ domain-containing protein [Phycisphaerae bacterium]|jgi:hypothetical protein|nr:PilZ domain-containing protein [Phycisphaerae bacterium]HOB73210.1 PilZ domain-containing protein [Phycisphaerae bacterium]HOJ55123.1 PilZ domain-containing protein [Phycisphaerae bacterium]HOL27910.1 PilZ domain-containing protein [Phycisphaerae bacterium]HPP21747.1 PilZ domain-containing protein [Phycisphaerae bacterium]